jgi:Rap1a immunity proteins
MNCLSPLRAAALGCLLGCAAVQASGAPAVPSGSGVTIDSVNLSAESFFAAYTSKDESERQRAHLYLLGVQDATEGKLWCDYKTLKTVTLREFVFEYFKKQPEARMKERASRVIEDALRSSFPCERKTRKK